MSKHYEQRKAANERYLSKMDEIRIRMSKESGLKEAIQAHAESTGESVQAFIIRAITQTMEQDKAGVSPILLAYLADAKKSAECFDPAKTEKERWEIVNKTSYIGANPSKEFKQRNARNKKDAE